MAVSAGDKRRGERLADAGHVNSEALPTPGAAEDVFEGAGQLVVAGLRLVDVFEDA
jgi:hypothetical protein